MSKLIEAVKEGNVAKVREMLSTSDINGTDEVGDVSRLTIFECAYLFYHLVVYIYLTILLFVLTFLHLPGLTSNTFVVRMFTIIHLHIDIRYSI